jgi:hypothetical protein
MEAHETEMRKQLAKRGGAEENGDNNGNGEMAEMASKWRNGIEKWHQNVIEEKCQLKSKWLMAKILK